MPATGGAYLDYSRPLGVFSYLKSTDCVLHFFDIIPLLRPMHPCFQHKQGFIEDYAAYKHDPESEHWLVYPRCRYEHKDNPYRRYRLSRSHTARTFSKLNALKEAQHLDNLKAINFDLTFDKDISKWLAQQPGGLDIAWRKLDLWLDNCLAPLMPEHSTMALWVTLHFWSTDHPLEPHFHFHGCLLNYVEVPASDDPGNGQTHSFVERLFPINENGKRLPFTKKQLKWLRAGLRRAQRKLAKRHHIDCPSLRKDKETDLFVAYLDFNKEDHIPRIINRLKYMTRPPIVDYAKASNKNHSYPWPTERILRYSTRVRTFGYAKRLKPLIGEVDDSDLCKPSPLTGKKMEYIGRFTREQVLAHAQGQLGRLDFRKGEPMFGELTEQELDWFKAVDYSEYPNPGWYKEHKNNPTKERAQRAPP